VRRQTFVLAALLIGCPHAIAQDTRDDDLLDALQRSAASISEKAASDRSKLSGVVKRNTPPPPQLAGLGAVKLGYTLQQVVAALGPPSLKSPGDGESQRYTYQQSRGVLSVSFNASNIVTTISTTSGDIEVPKGLRTGMLLEQFEATYGGVSLRSSRPFSVGTRLVSYPLSRLAMVVRSEGNQVEAIMVFQ
jgi:hypothetical protein